MSCKKYQKMLFLNRPGELSPSELQELKQHLSACTACATLQKKASHDAEIIKSVRQATVNVPNASQLTDDILGRARSQQFSYKAKNSKWTDHFFLQFALPRLRIILAAFIVLIIIGFLSQEVVILRRISKLEEQLAEKKVTPSPAIRKNMNINSFLKNIDHIARIKNDKMLIDKHALETLLKSYNELKINNKILLQYFRAHKAEFEGLNEKNINFNKIKEILKRDKRLRQLIQES